MIEKKIDLQERNESTVCAPPFNMRLTGPYSRQLSPANEKLNSDQMSKKNKRIVFKKWDYILNKDKKIFSH